MPPTTSPSPGATRARAGAAAALVLATAASIALWVRTPSSPPSPPVAPAPVPSAPPSPAQTADWPTPYSVSPGDLPPASDLPPGTIRILVLGDSVASFLGAAMRHRQDEARAFVAERGVGSCSIFEARVRIENGQRVQGTSCSAAWVEDVAELRPDVTLLVLGGAFLGEQACTPAWLASYERRVLDLVAAMGPAAGRVMLTRVPYPMGGWRHGNVLAQYDCGGEMLRRTATRGHLDLLDLMAYLCPTPACLAESRGHPIRPDGLHFDGVGAEETARWTLRELRRMAAGDARGASPGR